MVFTRELRKQLLSNRHISPKQNGMVSAFYEKKQDNTLILLPFLSSLNAALISAPSTFSPELLKQVKLDISVPP